VPTGSTVRQTITLDNSATNVNSISLAFPFTISGLPATGYSRPTGGAGGTCGTSLAAGSTCTIVVQFAPTTVATYPASLTISGSGAAAGLVLPVVTITGAGVPPTYLASITPSSVSFGNETVGATSATQLLTVKNTGNSPLSGMTITGIASPFTRVTTGFAANLPNCGSTLAVGASCGIKVAFAPTATGSASATVTVGGTPTTTIHPPSPVSASVSGIGVAPQVTYGSASFGTLAGNTLAFGNPAGTVSSTVTLNVVGGGSVTFGTAAVAGTRFSKGTDNCSGKTVAAGGSCTITINFNGTGTTPRTGTLTVVDSSGNAVASNLSLTGS
jgi:hypothetical protein